MSDCSNFSDFFSVGSLVSCKTCHNQIIEGEVLAFDQPTKMLILKSPSSCGRPCINDAHVVNLGQVSDVQVKREATSSPPPHPVQNVERLKKRVKLEVERKQHMITALESGVTPEGLKLFSAVKRTIDDITWEGKNIRVMEYVTITPPYLPENVQGSMEKAVTHVKKIVEKHLKDQSDTKGSNSENNSSPGPAVK
uniref:EOG090X0FOW n=1 Tax=Alona affinis TaxID=381656 RepID=A0A9N6WRE7_9CRUS|nr:EOG090X0FOW [Alona affinis]